MKKVIRLEWSAERQRCTEVRIERGGLKKLGEAIRGLGGVSQVFILTDRVCRGLFDGPLEECLKGGQVPWRLMDFNLTEASKSLAQVETVYEKLMEKEIDRRSVVVALGGGVVTDLGGFAAATILRGVPLIQVPTTLLAQVDAAIGGKTGVNFKKTKNWIGAFYQPQMILIDPDLIGSLEERHLKNGLVEVIKYGVIREPSLLDLVERQGGDFGVGKRDFYDEVIERSVRCKVQVVVEDEREEGQRAILNFGHTLGHALELECENLLHGEAVALGICFAARLSQVKGLCSEQDVARILKILGDFLPSIKYNQWNVDSVMARMFLDKKRIGQGLKMVLLRALGEVELTFVDQNEVKELFLKPHLWWRDGG